MKRKLIDALARTLGLAVLWIVVSEARPDFWYYGVITVVTALAVSAWTLPLGRPMLPPSRWLALLGFLIWFLRQAVVGAFDVARRALGPGRLVDPINEEVPVRLHVGQGRLFAAACCNLMPGSLIHRITDDGAELHSLTPALNAADSWEAVQQRVGRLAGPAPEIP